MELLPVHQVMLGLVPDGDLVLDRPLELAPKLAGFVGDHQLLEVGLDAGVSPEDRLDVVNPTWVSIHRTTLAMVLSPMAAAWR
ncbi:MAG: hypothetical protein R2710_30000 [Acidimicrobiales bacterium]